MIFERLAYDFLDSAIVSFTKWTVLYLFAGILYCFADSFSFLRIFSKPEELRIFSAVILIQQQSGTFFANGLEDVEDMFEVANVIDRKVEGDVSKVTWAHDEVL